jgi:hypothetical protein
VTVWNPRSLGSAWGAVAHRRVWRARPRGRLARMSGLAKPSARAIDGSDVDLVSYPGEALAR